MNAEQSHQIYMDDLLAIKAQKLSATAELFANLGAVQRAYVRELAIEASKQGDMK